jgi:DNA primase
VYQFISPNISNIFDVVREAVPLDRLLETNGSRKARCVAHDDQDPSLHVYDDHAHCFACGFHGDVVDVWATMQGIKGPFEAALDLARAHNIRLPELNEASKERAEERRKQEDDYLEQAKSFHAALADAPHVREWWEGRGFDAELRERFLLGAASAGTASIPFWVRGGRVAGIIRRKRTGTPKYELPTAEEFPTSHRPLFVPGPVKGEALLLEGYVDALAVAATGRGVVAVGGTGISAAQAAEIRDLNFNRITILPDADAEGEQAARQWGRQFFPATRIAPPDYGGEPHKDIADLFAAAGTKGTTEHLDRLVDSAKDPIDLQTAVAAELGGGSREQLAYATEHIVPLLARIHPAGMKDATADIVADRVDGLKKQWLNNAIKDEMERLEGEMAVNLMRQAEETNERMRAEYQALVEKAQPEIDELFEPGVLERLRNAAAKVHHVERDERALEMAILIALGAQLAPLPNGRPSGASALLTAEAGRGKNHLADAAVELLPEEFYEAFEIVSSQAFYYGVENDPDFLRHTFVYPNEIEGVEALVEFLRPMLSKGWCKKHVTDKDPVTGRNTMRTMIVEGPVTTIIPTVRNKTDDQLQTRLLMAELEDYLGRVKIHSHAISTLYHPDHAQADFSHDKFLWAEGLKQLTSVRRVVFRLEHPDFAYDDDQVTHGARLWANLLGLMSAHAWLEQRNRRILDVGGGEQAIEATPDDYETAFNVFTEVCKRTTLNLSDTHRKILRGIDKLEQDEPGREGFNQREIAKAAGVSPQAVSKHKAYLVTSAKLLQENYARLCLAPGVKPEEWESGDFTKGLPSPDQVREWWTNPTPPDGCGNRGSRGRGAEEAQKADTYAQVGVHGERGSSVDASTPSTPEGDRGRVHGVSTEGVDSENGIGKRDADDKEGASTGSTPNHRPTSDEVERVRRLVREGMSPKLARAEV